MAPMIADTAMAMFKLAPVDPHWYRDPAVVGRALDAILDTPLGALVHWAGLAGEAKKAPDRAAVHALVATGAEDIFGLMDAKRSKRMSMTLSIVEGAFNVDARCYGPEMAVRPTAIDDLVAVALALRSCGVFLGLRVGFVSPFTQSRTFYEFEREKPRAGVGRAMRNGAILELIDIRFHASDGPGSDPAEVRLAQSEVPDWVKRTETDGLVRLEWAQTIADKRALDRACEAHEDWLDRNLPA